MNKKAIDYGEAFEKHVGRVMAKWRKRRSLTQDNVGKDLEASGRTIGKYENCKIPIRASTMAAVSQVCKFDMIEYVLMNGESLSEKFRYLVNSRAKHGFSKADTLDSPAALDTPSVVYDMQFITMDGNRAVFSGILANEHWDVKKRKRTEDILDKEPDNYPLPLCDDDSRDFEVYMYSNSMTDKRRILIYGYELLKLYENIDSPWNSMEALAKQLLRRLLREPSGGIDQRVYDYYWKCVYSK